MSIDSELLPRVPFRDLFDGRMVPFGVTEHLSCETTPTLRCLTDGGNWIRVYEDEEGFARLDGFGSDGLGCGPERFMRVLSEVFGTGIVSEYEPEYFGFESYEEWRYFQDEAAAKRDAELYEDLIKCVNGTENNFKSGTAGETWAKKAKALVADNPKLALREHKTEFFSAVTGHSFAVLGTKE